MDNHELSKKAEVIFCEELEMIQAHGLKKQVVFVDSDPDKWFIATEGYMPRRNEVSFWVSNNRGKIIVIRAEN